MTRVVCCQLAPQLLNLEANRTLALNAIRAALQAGAKLIVLPELVTSGYIFASREEAASVAITADDDLLADWARAAGAEGAVIVGGFCERDAHGRLYNSAAIVDGSGVRAVYRKLHLWDRERLWFTAGSEAPPVVETAAGRIGVIVCYDLEFAEMTRMMGLGGTDILAVPTNWPLGPRPPGERPPEVVMAMAAARMNRMAIACCDRSGTERGQAWTAGTSIIDRSGWVVATPTADGMATAELDLLAGRDERLSPRNDLFGDRRTDVYDLGP